MLDITKKATAAPRSRSKRLLPEKNEPAIYLPHKAGALRASLFSTPDRPTLPGIKGDLTLASAPPLPPASPRARSSLGWGLSPNSLKARDWAGSGPPLRPEVYPSVENPLTATQIPDYSRPPLATLVAAATATGEGPTFEVGVETSAALNAGKGKTRGTSAWQKTVSSSSSSSSSSCLRRVGTELAKKNDVKISDGSARPLMPYWRRRREIPRADSNSNSNSATAAAAGRRRIYFAPAAGGTPEVIPAAAAEVAAAAAAAETAAAAAAATVPCVRYGIMQQRQLGTTARGETKAQKRKSFRGP